MPSISSFEFTAITFLTVFVKERPEELAEFWVSIRTTFGGDNMWWAYWQTDDPVLENVTVVPTKNLSPSVPARLPMTHFDWGRHYFNSFQWIWAPQTTRKPCCSLKLTRERPMFCAVCEVSKAVDMDRGMVRMRVRNLFLTGNFQGNNIQ